MKNILGEKPTEDLHGRLFASVQFVEDRDIKDKEVLDIGCGYGWFELNALKRGVKKIVGIEISEEDLKTAKEHVTDNRARFQVSGATKLPFPDESFDTVVSWEVIEHIPKDTENLMFSEVHRVLKPGGTFYLSTPHDSFFANILDPAWWLIGHRHYSKEQLEKYAKNSTFKVVEVKIKGGWWTVCSLLNMYVSKWILRRQRILEKYSLSNEHEEYLKDDGFFNIFVRFRRIE